MSKRSNKPRVITKCVANHYTGPDERIIEFTFGPDGRGGSFGGLIQFVWAGMPTVTVYNYDSEVKVIVDKPADRRS